MAYDFVCHQFRVPERIAGARFAAAIKRIAAELARIRKKLKLTRQEAARITGGGPNAFSRYERGKARPLPAVTNLFTFLIDTRSC